MKSHGVSLSSSGRILIGGRGGRRAFFVDEAVSFLQASSCSMLDSARADCQAPRMQCRPRGDAMQVSGNYHYPCRFTILNFRTVEAMFIRGLPCLHYKYKAMGFA